MSGRKRLKSVEIKVPNNVKVTVNGLNRKSEIESEIKALDTELDSIPSDDKDDDIPF